MVLLLDKILSYFLNIETATTVCSVSISENERLLFCKELNEGFTHAENLHLFIHEAFQETGIQARQLDAIAVSKGPGSYTGLRIGVSTAKGLAYALRLPLISIDTLQIMAASARALKKEEAFYCSMIDARRMEIYTAVYNSELRIQDSVQALIIDEESINQFKTYSKVFFYGDGMPKCRDLLTLLSNADFIDNIHASAEYMPNLVNEKFVKSDFEDLAYSEPFYLKDFLAGKKKTSFKPKNNSSTK